MVSKKIKVETSTYFQVVELKIFKKLKFYFSLLISNVSS